MVVSFGAYPICFVVFMCESPLFCGFCVPPVCFGVFLVRVLLFWCVFYTPPAPNLLWLVFVIICFSCGVRRMRYEV